MKPRSMMALTAALAASACTNLGTTAARRFEAHGGAATETREATALYARDGSVVAGGGVQGGEIAPRELRESDSGRTYILELYQKAIDERDSLRTEVDALNVEMVRAREQLAGGRGELELLQARVAQLEALAQQRLDENIELAARLVTAQIRRLQAEKVLLEARLAQSPVAQTTEKK